MECFRQFGIVFVSCSAPPLESNDIESAYSTLCINYYTASLLSEYPALPRQAFGVIKTYVLFLKRIQLHLFVTAYSLLILLRLIITFAFLQLGEWQIRFTKREISGGNTRNTSQNTHPNENLHDVSICLQWTRHLIPIRFFSFESMISSGLNFGCTTCLFKSI